MAAARSDARGGKHGDANGECRGEHRDTATTTHHERCADHRFAFQAQFFHPAVQRLARQAELARGLGDDALGTCERLLDVIAIDGGLVGRGLRVSQEAQSGYADRRLA